MSHVPIPIENIHVESAFTKKYQIAGNSGHRLQYVLPPVLAVVD